MRKEKGPGWLGTAIAGVMFVGGIWAIINGAAEVNASKSQLENNDTLGGNVINFSPTELPADISNTEYVIRILEEEGYYCEKIPPKGTFYGVVYDAKTPGIEKGPWTLVTGPNNPSHSPGTEVTINEMSEANLVYPGDFGCVK